MSFKKSSSVKTALISSFLPNRFNLVGGVLLYYIGAFATLAVFTSPIYLYLSKALNWGLFIALDIFHSIFGSANLVSEQQSVYNAFKETGRFLGTYIIVSIIVFLFRLKRVMALASKIK